ncbi:hypothetical protein AK812_SmicGene9563 [Symbiodinium microadriaticum]|uniref:Integrase catalytic domain-containing protein n=1 Tax=Symbiodinium microadriaticum TaxID=2951 RepID=A0A1Q9EI32_SYMMI|nr:hypothetical protein AK812_SmicGene9563 [Symbiodinium microadriaticum]
MIGQAWGKYSRDRKLLKATAQDVREAFETVAAQDYDAALAEPFVGLAGNWPYPSRPSLGHTLLAAARHRGHQVTTASLQSFDRRPFFMCFRLAGPSPLLNFSGKQARLDAEKKNLESEAAVLQAAMAQRRSGRHFLIEFGRGARPDRTPEGKELLEELGEADFVMNGRRYVTSSPSFVTALRAGKDAALDDLAAMTLQGIERQFDEDHQAGNVHEGLAAETFDGDGSLLDLEEDESDVDEPGPVTEEERTVKAIPVAVRQAVRRLHENTGHRSPLRLARALVIAGAPPEAILAAKQLKCSLCDERRPPKVQRPASLPGPRDPGDQVGIDIFDVFDGVGTRFSVLHAVDAATRFQMAVLVERKASEEVVNFIRERWAPVFGVPRTLVCDQGREFISHELEDFASGVNMHLYHIAVGAPWQNGLCERTGGILKTLVSACVAARSLMGTEEMKVGLAEGLLAYNMDVGDSGFSPMQAAVGRQPMLPGDALGGGRLGELEAMENPSYARLMAVREAAKMAMLRLHFSRSLKRAEKARSRNPTLVSTPAVGDLVYYWREQKYNKRASYNKRRLLLKKWHGPALLVAFEGSNCYVTARGTLTKVALEHVRRASAMEQLASGEWESVLQEIVDAAARDQEWEVIPQQGSGDSDGGPPPPGPPDGDDGPGLGEQPTLPEPTRGPMAPSTADGAPALGHLGLDVSDGAGLEQPTVPEPGGPLLGRVLPFRDQLRQAMSRGQEQRGRDLPPVSTGEFVKATSGSAAGDSRRPSTLLGRRVSGASSSRAPGTPVPECILGAGGGEERSPVGPFEAETEPDGGSTKRPAELDAETLRDKAQGSDDTVPFDAMVMERSEVLAAAQAREGEVHPLVKLQAQAAMDRLSGDIGEAGDHGTWDGRWPLPSRTEYEAFVQAGLKWPTTRDAFVVQAARKEYHWSSMGPEQKAAFKDAAAEAWNVWLRNEAVEVLSDAESEKVWATLRQRGELHKVLTPRFVYTDKNDGQRTQQNNLPLKASARLVVPGYKDITAYGLRKDAPTASRTSQHLLFSVAASKFQDGWRMGTADVKSAFMKGERYMEGTRELYVKNVEVRGDSPSLPVGRKLSRVLKGVFGLADAPREWFLRLRKSVVRRGWRTSTMDAATFFLWSQDSTPRLLGMLCSHVDDLLFCGGPEAWSSIRELGDELGFGSLEENAFVYCGKRVAQDLASGEVTVSMKEYHQNLKEVRLPSSRRRDPDASLTPGEHKQLRALVGSLQWLVAQVRFDAGFLLSALQAETPTVNTLLKINQLIKLFKETGDFELRFRPLDLRNAGILVVTDASLGNVTRTGAVGSQPLERVYSQSCYCVLLAEASLMRGEKGRFTVLDHRSHRLQRVCRSTFAAELLGVEEGTDAGQYCRGHVAELQGYDLGHRGVDCILDNIDMVIVTDAKDVYDKGNSDTPSYGSQKSLAFTVAWLRGMLGRGNTALRWTATENMFVDCGTKEMDGAHMRKILGEGEWSYRFDADLVKQTVRARAPVQRGPRVLSGQSVASSDPVLAFLQGLSTQKGWHRRNTTAIQASPIRDTDTTSKERRLALLFMLRTHLVEIDVWQRWLQPKTDTTGGSVEEPRVSLYFHVTDLQAAGPEVVQALQALPGTRKIIAPVATGWCELLAAEVALLQAALLDDPGAAMFVLLPHDARVLVRFVETAWLCFDVGTGKSWLFCMHTAAFAQVHYQWKKLFATMCFFIQTDRVCMDKASASALRGGVAAAVVQAICVPAFMWMRTVTNYQYRHGGRVLDVARRLYAEGGPRRFYRGVVPALVQSPVLRFGGLAVNEGLLSVTANYSVSHTATAALSSAAATGLKILLMPLDAWQTAKQVNGQQGLTLLMIEAKKRPLSLWRGTAGCLTGTWVAHYAWCFTNNYLHDALPTSAFGNSDLARGASIGFISNVAGDCCSNFLRVLKVIRQTAGGSISYHDAVKELLQRDGVRGLFGRGLPTKVASSGLQGAAFLIGYEAVLRSIAV